MKALEGITVNGQKPTYVSFSGFETEVAKATMHNFNTKIVPVEAWTDLPAGNGPYREITFKVGDTEMFVLAFDDPKDPMGGYDTSCHPSPQPSAPDRQDPVDYQAQGHN